jgi:hypothetical protein
MNKIVLAILLGFIILNGFSQQTYQYRYHIFDDYLLNPAYVGSGNYYSIQTGHDQRFSGLANSTPRTYFLSAHSRLGEGYLFEKDGKINKFFGNFGNAAIGLQFFHYEYGPHIENNIGLTYGYHLGLSPNQRSKSPRKMVLAFTPRLQRVAFNIHKLGLTDERGILIDDYDNNFSFAGIDKLTSWIFTTDVGAIYQTKHVDVGLGGLLLFKGTRNRLETDSLYLSDETLSTYDLLYSSKFMSNVKIKFLTMHESSVFDLDFIPSFSVLYAPKTTHAEMFLDLKLDGYFKKRIAGIRSEVIINSQLGVNIHYLKSYTDKHLSVFNPYMVFDFKNYAITYMHSFYLNNDLVSVSGIGGGSQVSVLLKLGNDRIVRKVDQKSYWK